MSVSEGFICPRSYGHAFGSLHVCNNHDVRISGVRHKCTTIGWVWLNCPLSGGSSIARIQLWTVRYTELWRVRYSEVSNVYGETSLVSRPRRAGKQVRGRGHMRRSGLVYTVPEVPKIWVLVIVGKLPRKTFRKRIRNHRSRPFLFLQRWMSSMLPCRTPCPVFS